MANRVQVSHGIRDRQIYQTLVKMDKSLGDANRFIERASGNQAFTDATASPGAPTQIEVVTISTGYIPADRGKLSLFTVNFYNWENTTLTGTYGVRNVDTLLNEDGEVIILAELWTADNYSFTGLSADWVLLEIKP